MPKIIVNSESENESANAGEITLTTSFLTLKDEATIESSANKASGGDITVMANDIRLFNSNIIAKAEGKENSNAGIINLTAKNAIILFDGSQISAGAEDGQGGEITLNTEVFLADNDNDKPAISATSRTGENGSVTLNTPEVDISNSLLPLSEKPTNSSQLIAAPCSARKLSDLSSFVVTGRGQLRFEPDANQPLPANYAKLLKFGNITQPQTANKLPMADFLVASDCHPLYSALTN